MSVRGMEIHNGYLDLPEGMPQTLHLGTEASPLTQGVASQIVISAVIDAVAALDGGEAGVFIVIASESLTGILTGLRVETIVNDGFTVTPPGGAHTDSVFGAVIKTEILGAGVIAGRWEGLRISMEAAAGAESESNVFGIFISNTLNGTQSANAYYFIRGQENGTYTVQYCLYFRGGTGGVNYFALLHGDTDGWNALGSPGTANGWIKCDVGGLDRWIQLYSVAP